MATLLILLAAAVGLLSTAAIGRVTPRPVGILRGALCLVGLAAALLAPGIATVEFGLTFGIDGLSSFLLAALFLLVACGAAGPGLAGLLALALLSGDAVGIVLALGAAILLAPGTGARGLRAAALACVAVVLLLLAWHGTWPELRLAAIRAIPPGTLAIVATPIGALATLVLLPLALPAIPGSLVAFYLVARFMLDLPGPTTPGWWGVPLVLLGTGLAVVMARRAAAGTDLLPVAVAAWRSTTALGAAVLGVALLARGADTPSLVALAVASSLFLVLSSALWGGLLLLVIGALQRSVGTSALARLGGLLNRTPATGLALLVAMASLAALPLTAGFAALWWALQALLAVSRLGGSALLALAAGVVAATGLVVALQAATALRVCGLVLLGPARSTRAANARDGALYQILPMAALALATLAVGLVPSLGTMLVQPAARLLSTASADGAGVWTLATTGDGPGYSAPALALLLGTCLAAAAWAGRGARTAVPAWRGGLPEDSVAAPLLLPVVLWPDWRTRRPSLTGRGVFIALLLLLAAALGWSVR